MKKWQVPIMVVMAVLVACAILMAIPFIRESVFIRVDQAKASIRYALDPPEKKVFVPQEDVAAIVNATMTALAPTSTPNATPTPTHAPDLPTPTPAPTATRTPSPTPVPQQIMLKGVRYMTQQGMWNYCAPANLAMALSFWGWQGDRLTTGKVLKPYDKDKNVMPYEMLDYVESQTELGAMVRMGGTANLLKSLIASGFPVVVEKGAYMPDVSNKITWMGHYLVVTGYDEGRKQFIGQDSYYEADYPVPYDEFMTGWRDFNYIFLVIFPKDRQQEVERILGPYADEKTAFQIAAATSSTEVVASTGTDKFFAWFNRGTSLLKLEDYGGAAKAYDEAFKLYPTLAEGRRPWRMMWYQTGPYFAYFYLGRYYDVMSLATQTIEAANEPFIEETFYWRGKAKAALGDKVGAINDYRESLKYHPGFGPSIDELQGLGVKP